MKSRILLIEDDENIATLLKCYADIYDYQLLVETDGVNGFRAIERERPHLIVLDILLPGETGYDVCRKIRSHPQLKDIPIIMISAKSEELDVILGLELGADDYIIKPFSPRVFFSRVKAILRRKKRKVKEEKVIVFGPFVFYSDQYLLKKDGKELLLTLSEMEILKRLILHRGKVVSRSQLLDAINNEDRFITDRNIDVHVAALRKKMGKEAKWIKTIRGIGYCFNEGL